jgi:hypothetical protein
MQQKSTFSNWSIAQHTNWNGEKWQIDNNSDYPRLKNEIILISNKAYRTIKRGGWTNSNNWQVWNGSSWSATSNTPGSGDQVFIRHDGFSLNGSQTCQDLFIETGNLLRSGSVSNKLTVEGEISGFEGFDGGAQPGPRLAPEEALSQFTLKLTGPSRFISRSMAWSKKALDQNNDLDLELNLNSGASATLNAPIAINGDLTLTQGKLETDDGAELIMESGSSVSNGASSGSHVAGPVIKAGSSSFTFPIGKDGKVGEVTIDPGSSLDFKAEYFKSQSGKTGLGSNLNNISQQEHWDLNTDANSPSVDVTLHWNDGTFSGISNLSNSDPVIAHYDGSQWISEGQDAHTGSPGSGSITVNKLSSFSEYTFGSTSSNDNALPVELTTFEVQPLGNEAAKLSWATASETHNRHFSVQRRLGDQWQTIGEVAGAGTTTEPQDYAWRDENVNPGETYYYRLKQVDYDGSYEYSDIKAVKLNGNEEPDGRHELAIFPNPVSERLRYQYAGEDQAEVRVVIRNAYGQEVLSGKRDLKAGSTDELSVQHLTPGQYVLILQSQDLRLQKRFVKAK